MGNLLVNLSNASKINWAIRIKNPIWWVKVVVAFVTPIFVYYGITGQSVDTWAKAGNLLTQAFSNPYVLFTALLSATATSIDPTTTGLSDSTTALTFVKPNNK